MERALARLANGAVLSPSSDGKGFAIYPNGDRRGRPIARLSMIEMRMLVAEGSIHAAGDGYAITEAGRAQARRARALRDEAYAAQHRPVIDRTVIDASGTLTRTRGHDADGCLRRLAALRDASGAPWLSAAEVAVASRLRADWERGECGLVRGSDWSAPPKGGAARGPGNALEGAIAGHCDAGRRGARETRAAAAARRRMRVLARRRARSAGASGVLASAFGEIGAEVGPGAVS
jgi:hypothetical protein